MKKILKIVSSPRGGSSFSIKLSDSIVDKLLAANPGSTVLTHDLTSHPLPHLEEAHLTSFFTPKEKLTPEDKEAIAHSDNAIKELMEADIIVIGAPMYNFSIPSTLKSWIEHIARAGITFNYSDKGPVGMVTNKKVYVAISSGGVYSEGLMKSYDFIEPYLKAVLGFLGMTDVSFIRVEGVSMPGNAEAALQKAEDTIAV